MSLPKDVNVYTVITKKGIDDSDTKSKKQSVKTKLTTTTTKVAEPNFPTRHVATASNAKLSLRTDNYILSASEATDLLNDPEIQFVEPYLAPATPSFYKNPDPGPLDLTGSFTGAIDNHNDALLSEITQHPNIPGVSNYQLTASNGDVKIEITGSTGVKSILVLSSSAIYTEGDVITFSSQSLGATTQGGKDLIVTLTSSILHYNLFTSSSTPINRLAFFTTESLKYQNGWTRLGVAPLNTYYILAGVDSELVSNPNPEVQKDLVDTYFRTQHPDIGYFFNPSNIAAAQRNANGLYKESYFQGNINGTWFLTSSVNSPPTFSFSNITLDGTGVDIIICDPGSFSNPWSSSADAFAQPFSADNSNVEFHGEFRNDYEGSPYSNRGNLKLDPINWNTHLGLESGSTGFIHPALTRIFPEKLEMGHNLWYSKGNHGRGMATNTFGNIMGLAPGAKCYYINIFEGGRLGEVAPPPIPIDSPGGPTRESGASLDVCMDMARLFHESKSINPDTGVKRPTIFVLSYGVSADIRMGLRSDGVGGPNPWRTHINTHSFGSHVYTYADYLADGYLNSSFPPNEANLPYSTALNSPTTFQNLPFIHLLRVLALDAVAQDMCDAGVIMVKAGGNNPSAVFQSGSENDPDWDPIWSSSHYNDYYSFDIDIDTSVAPDGTPLPGLAQDLGITYANTPIYYNRGSSPMCDKTIYVGGTSVNQLYEDNEGNIPWGIERQFSKGPRVDVFALNSHIQNDRKDAQIPVFTSSFAPENFGISVNPSDPVGADIDNFGYCIGGGGTSFAGPTTAGVIALYLQLNPSATSKDVKKWLLEHSSPLGGDISESRYGDRWPSFLTYGPSGASSSRREPGETGDPVFGGHQNRVLYNPYNAISPLQTSGSITFNNGASFKIG